MKFAALVVAAGLPLAAQEIKFPANLDKLAEKASDVVDVTMDSSLLQLASRFLSDKDPDEAKVKKLLVGIKGLYVRNIKFDSRGEYQQSDLDPIRAQVKGAGWSRIVGVRSKRDGDNAEIFVKSDQNQVSGLVIIVAEPLELTVVNIIGSIKPEDVADLSGHFGFPDIGIKNKSRKDSKDKDDEK